jgi:hypothetical protein
MKRCPGTVAAIVLGVLATIGSAAFGIANLQALFDVRASAHPRSVPAVRGPT